MIYSYIITIIDTNAKEVKCIVKKLQKSGHFESAVKTIIFCNVVLLAVDVMIPKMYI